MSRHPSSGLLGGPLTSPLRLDAFDCFIVDWRNAIFFKKSVGCRKFRFATGNLRKESRHIPFVAPCSERLQVLECCRVERKARSLRAPGPHNGTVAHDRIAQMGATGGRGGGGSGG